MAAERRSWPRSGDADDPVELHAEVAKESDPEASSRKLIEWADANKMRRALERWPKLDARGADADGAPEPELPKAATKAAPGEEL